MKLFPYALIRVGGSPFETLQPMEFSETIVLMDEIRDLRNRIEEMRGEICDLLYHAIPETKEHATQKRLLNLKRDVFNARPISSGKLAFLKNNLPDPELIDRFGNALADVSEKTEKAGECFKKELLEARQCLQGLTELENLKRGLVLSSQSLFRANGQYARKNPRKLKKQNLKTELSLIKYLTRICDKTSPFSTFTHLAMGELVEATGEDVYPQTPERSEAVGHIRINNYLFKYLIDLFKKHPEYRANILIRPNPTLKKEPENYLYLTNSNNVESFQRIPLNPVLDLFWELTASKKEGVSYRGLVEMAGEAVDAEPEDLAAYIDQLLEYGFLEFNFGVSGIDPDWDLKLCDVLRGWPNETPFLADFLEMLECLRQNAQKYGAIDSPGRTSLLEDSFERFKKVCFALHEAADLPEIERMSPEERRAHQEAEKKAKEDEEKEEEADEENASENEEESEDKEEVFKHLTVTAFQFKPEQMFYEDAALPEKIPMNRDAIGRVIETTHQLYESLDILNGQWEARQPMTHYFRENYTEPVDLLSFYEAFYRDFKKPQAELIRKRKEWETAKKEKEDGSDEKKPAEDGDKKIEPPSEEEAARFKIPVMTELETDRKQWQEHFEKALGELPDQAPQTVNIRHDQIEAANKASKRKPKPRDHETSFGLFVQFFREGGHLRGVMNANPFGFGKMFSRFLHILDPVFPETVRERNRELYPDTYLLENCDASIFNANLHPPLMPYEVWMPGGQNSLPPEKQIPITEISVGLKENDRLGLFHNGKPLLVFDLGFQSPRGRSELFQMLSLFCPTVFIMVNTLTYSINKKWDAKKNGDGVVYRPRIIYEDRLVIQRRYWLFPKQTLPLREPGESFWDYYHRVYQWKEDHGLPDRVFIKVTGFQELEGLDEDLRKKVGRDDYKPQYLSFRNPILIRLFEKLVEKTPVNLTISEMLPDADDLAKFDENRYVTEYVVQWDTGTGDPS